MPMNMSDINSTPLVIVTRPGRCNSATASLIKICFCKTGLHLDTLSLPPDSVNFANKMFLNARVLLPEMETLVKNINAVEQQMQFSTTELYCFSFL